MPLESAWSPICIDASKEDLSIGMQAEVMYQKYQNVTLPRVRKA